jgi:Spy/CpxP family protein refolding chaperone
MPETKQETETRKPLWMQRRFWLAGGAILAGLVVLAAIVPRASAYRALAGHGFGPARAFASQGFGPGRHAFGSQILKDPEAAKQHVGMAVEWALRGVDATEDQKQKARQITDRLIDQLAPEVQKHKDFREAMARELAKPEIDRAALERLRQQEIALADTASKQAVTAVADLGDVLTPEQRTELISFVHRFHGEAAAH